MIESGIQILVSSVCNALEAGHLDEAAEGLRSAAGGASAEALVLEKLVERRRGRSDEGWLEDLIGAWIDTGRPWQFGVVSEEGIGDKLERAFSDAAGIDVVEIIEELTEGMFASAPLLLLMATGWRPGGADVLARQAMAAIPRALTLHDKLWLGELLSHRKISTALLPEVRLALKQLRAEIARAHPNDFSLVAMDILDDGGHDDPPLTPGQIHGLSCALERHRPSVTIGDLYDALLEGRGAATSWERRGCFADAVALQPNPLVEIKVRAEKVLLEASEGWEELLRLLAAVGDVYGKSQSLLERLPAIVIAHLAADASGDLDRALVFEEELEHVRRVARAENRFPLWWPIEQLRREVVDATAHEEWDLMERTAFPVPAQN